MASQVALVVRNLPANAGDVRDKSSIPGSGRCPGGEHGNPLQYSCLENSTDRGAWWATVHGAAKSRAWLSSHTRTHGMSRPATHWYLKSCPWKSLFIFAPKPSPSRYRLSVYGATPSTWNFQILLVSSSPAFWMIYGCAALALLQLVPLLSTSYHLTSTVAIPSPPHSPRSGLPRLSWSTARTLF